MSAVEILRQARELIADKRRWTQGAYARDGYRNTVWANDPAAVCWCAAGALNYITKLRGGYGAAAGQEVHSASITLFGGDIGQVNDGKVNLHGMEAHAAVLKVFDAAIAKAEAANA